MCVEGMEKAEIRAVWGMQSFCDAVCIGDLIQSTKDHD